MDSDTGELLSDLAERAPLVVLLTHAGLEREPQSFHTQATKSLRCRL